AAHVIKLHKLELGGLICPTEGVGCIEVDVAVASQAPLASAQEIVHKRVVPRRLKHEKPARLKHPVNFAECRHRIEEMFNDMKHYYDVGGRVGQASLLERGGNCRYFERLRSVVAACSVRIDAQDVPP